MMSQVNPLEAHGKVSEHRGLESVVALLPGDVLEQPLSAVDALVGVLARLHALRGGPAQPGQPRLEVVLALEVELALQHGDVGLAQRREQDLSKYVMTVLSK